MGLQTNLIRRGATYAWRRRLPTQLGGKLLQISLRTNDPDIAKRIAPIVTSESWHMYRAMMFHTLTKDDARTLLTAVIQRELRRIELERLTGVDSPCPLSWEDDRSHDWATGKALQLLSSRGEFGFAPGGERAHLNGLDPAIAASAHYLGADAGEMETIAIEYQEFGDKRFETSLAAARSRAKQAAIELAS
jgi:hypothetical protein